MSALVTAMNQIAAKNMSGSAEDMRAALEERWLSDQQIHVALLETLGQPFSVLMLIGSSEQLMPILAEAAARAGVISQTLFSDDDEWG
jgi:hypothetical protein